MQTIRSKYASTTGHILLIFSFIFALASCSDDVIPTSLDLLVQDKSGAPLADAQVKLFRTRQDWENNVQQVKSGVTDASGALSLSGLEAGSYFLDITKGLATNWNEEIAISIEAHVKNNETAQLSSSNATLLTGKVEKSWSMTGANLDGHDLFEDVDACEKDNIFFFQKEENVGLLHFGELKCIDEVEDQELFSWEFDDDETTLTINGQGGGQQVYAIDELDHETMKFTIAIDFEGQMVPVQFIFETLVD